MDTMRDEMRENRVKERDTGERGREGERKERQKE